MQCPLQLFPYRTQSVVVVEERQEFSGGGRGRKSLESPIDYGGRSRRSIAEEGEGARMSRRRRTKEAEEREQHYQVLSDALAFS